MKTHLAPHIAPCSWRALSILAGALAATPFAPTANAEEIRFGLVADTEYARSPSIPTWENNPTVIAALREMNATDPLRGVVVLGDLTYGGTVIDGDARDDCRPGDGYEPVDGVWAVRDWSGGVQVLSIWRTWTMNAFLRAWVWPDSISDSCSTALDYVDGGNIGIPTFIGLGNHDLEYSAAEVAADSMDSARHNIWHFIHNRHHPTQGVAQVRAGSFDDASKAYSWDWVDSTGRRLHLVNLQQKPGIPVHTDGETNYLNHPSNLPWLEKDLRSLRSGTPVILMAHFPFKDTMLDVGELDRILIETRANVIAAFHGHVHDFYEDVENNRYQSYTWSRIPLFCVASAGIDRRFVIVRVDLTAGSLTVEPYVAPGTQPDPSAITKTFTASAAGKAVWVNGAYTSGGSDGSFDRPYVTVTEGCNNAGAADTVRIVAGRYRETPVLRQVVRIESYGGAATIGAP